METKIKYSTLKVDGEEIMFDSPEKCLSFLLDKSSPKELFLSKFDESEDGPGTLILNFLGWIWPENLGIEESSDRIASKALFWRLFRPFLVDGGWDDRSCIHVTRGEDGNCIYHLLKMTLFFKVDCYDSLRQIIDKSSVGRRNKLGINCSLG